MAKTLDSHLQVVKIKEGLAGWLAGFSFAYMMTAEGASYLACGPLRPQQRHKWACIVVSEKCVMRARWYREVENISRERERENYIYGWLKPAQQQRYSVSTGWRDPPPFVLWPATHASSRSEDSHTLRIYVQHAPSSFVFVCVCMSPWFLGGSGGRLWMAGGSPKRINLITRAGFWFTLSCLFMFCLFQTRAKKRGRRKRKGKKRFGCQVNNLLHGESPLLVKE